MAAMRRLLPVLVLTLSGPLTVLPASADSPTLAALASEAGMEAYAVPLKAPAFALPGLDGETRDKHDYRGRVVLLNFWASWCPPCREEFPSLQRLQQTLGKRDFTVLAIAVQITIPR